MHQRGDTVRHFGNAIPFLAGLERKPVTRQRRRHHREGIAGIAAEPRRIGQARNDVEEFEHRTRPAVQQQQRHRVFADARHMQIMQVDAVDRNAELRKGIERRFLCPPIKPVAPIFDETAQIGDIGAIGPWIAGRRAESGKRVRARRSRRSAMSASAT